MRTPREIYEAYRIMPNLQLHQLRVAAVGVLICRHFQAPVNERDVTLACLFHDMGNIVKFDLGYFPEALEPQGREYWESVKREFEQAYGTEQHAASAAIGREIGLSGRVIEILTTIRFANLEEILAERPYERKITEYADCRVAPYGITSKRDRFVDGRKRYLSRAPSKTENDTRYDALTEAGYAIERQLFAQADLTPEDITDASAAPVIEELWEYPVL